jgi:small subunit ribosomal protein S18
MKYYNVVSAGSTSSGESEQKPGRPQKTQGFGSRQFNTAALSTVFDYKNTAYLRRFITDQGKLLSRRVTRLNSKQQSQLTKAVKQARMLGFLSCTPTTAGK